MTSRLSNERLAQRHRIIRELGYSYKEARAIAGPIDSFVECLRRHGIDPATYGDLALKLPAAKPRLQTQAAIQRRARYAELRRMGVPTATAVHLAQKPGRTQDAIRRLQQGLPLRQDV